MTSTFALHPDFDAPQWRGLMEEISAKIAALPDSARVLGGRNELYRFEFQGREVVAKRFVNRGLWKCLVQGHS
ncbi:hypothetical protein [Pelagicoccus mobilis]|uniref:Uncharacterized protein n=1 Tax=Pelagicoccus mobilis TaxID=415221 RepID=A0A934VNV6_9BACT|nr:hypothetical protein [Pelagicoccus mobilis]MBK1880356.1 hypothetical protein [Pelagicoccus mobilis]